jgi:GNAT superfamily N-acetyltransferase
MRVASHVSVFKGKRERKKDTFDIEVVKRQHLPSGKESKASLTPPRTDPELESHLADLTNRYYSFFHLDWSQDASKSDILAQLFAQTFGDDIFPEAWHLANVVTHTDYQRRGVGARLVKWGLDQAEAERVPVSVESSFAGVRLYEKMGFRRIDELRFGEREKETMPLMVWDPSGLEGRWFDRAKAAADARSASQFGFLS